MLLMVKALFAVSCENRLEALWWFFGRRYGRPGPELLLRLVWDGRSIVIPVADIQTLVAALGMFTAANPWARWQPAINPRRVIDLGGNIGLASLYFALRFPSAAIVAVEMMPENAAAIRRLADLNRVRIEVRNVAVGASDGQASVRLNRSPTRHGLEMVQSGDAEAFGFTDQRVSVPICRLGTLVRDLAWPSVDLLKVDIEGAEQLLLDDIDGWSDRVSTVFLEIHHNVDPASAEAAMTEHAYKRVGQDDHRRNELWFSK
jgi:FkbM family methyltransferase